MRYLFLLLALPVYSAELELKARIEPSGPYHLGDSLRFVWEVAHHPKVGLDSDLAGPLSAALQSAGFESASPSAATTVSQPPRVDISKPTEGRLVLSAPVTTFTTGVHRVPSIKVLYRDAAGARQSAQTPEMVVPVQSLLTAASEPRGVKPPVPYPWSPPLWPLPLLLVLSVLLLFTIHRLRRPRLVPPPPPLPPDREALARIDALLAENQPSPKEFCDGLSDILRHYLFRRFGPSMGDTSHELLSALATSLAPDDLASLTAFLQECDLAKFARHRPETAQLMTLVESARGLVLRTRPTPTAPEAPRDADRPTSDAPRSDAP